MTGRDWVPPLSLAFPVLFGGVQLPYILLTGLAADTPAWARVVAVSFPVASLTVYVWYFRRYASHRDRDVLFKYAGGGSLLGGSVYAIPGIGITLQQRAVGLPILNSDVLIIELWLGGSLIGLAVGHLYANSRTERERLRQLLDETRELITATDTAAIAENTVDAAERILGLNTSAIYTPENETTLEPLAATARTEDFFGRLPTIESQDAIAWSVLESGEPAFVDDVHDHPERYNPDTPVRSEMIIPVADTGVFMSASEEVCGFTERDRMLARLLISNAEAVLGRATNESRLREREQRLEEQRQRLTVLNRVLRHDIRTHTGVILSQTQQLERTLGDDRSLDKIRKRTNKIVELSDNARRIEKTIENSDGATRTVDVTDIVEANIQKLRETPEDIEVRADMPGDAEVVSNGLIEAAVENVLTNAVEHNDSDPPIVDVTVTGQAGDGEVVVRVADNGPGIPAHERDVFEQKEETPLQHSSGIGLWLVHWIIEDVNGTVEVEDRQSRGTTVRLCVPQPTTPVTEQEP